MAVRHVGHRRISYHILHSAQILGTLGVAVVFSQVCCCEAVLVPDAQVYPVNHKDLTALESDMRETERSDIDQMTVSVKVVAVLKISFHQSKINLICTKTLQVINSVETM